MMKRIVMSLVCGVLVAACGDDEPREVMAQPGTPDEDLGQLDMGPLDQGSDMDLAVAPINRRGSCAELTGTGSDHGGETITSPVVWSAQGSPHRITSTVTIAAGGSVLVDPCAVIVLDKEQSIVTRGIFEAVGTPGLPVLIEAADEAEPFGALACEDCIMRIFHTTILNGGSPSAGATAMVHASGRSARVADGITLDNVQLLSSGGNGLELTQNAGLSSESRSLLISDAAKAQVVVAPNRVPTIPAELTEVVVSTQDVLDEDSVWPARVEPYRIEDEGSLIVGAASTGVGSRPVSWTLEAGAQLVFGEGAMLIINAAPDADAGGALVSTGTIRAQGSVMEPVVFKGAMELPSYWGGILFRAAPTAQSQIDQAQIISAGAPPAEPGVKSCDPAGGAQPVDAKGASLTLLGAPPDGMVTNTAFTLSQGSAIEHAYQGAQVNLATTNTFEQIEGCIQTMPRDESGMCPAQGYTCP